MKLTHLSHTDGVGTLSLEVTGESVEEKEWLKGDPNGDGSSVVLDITDHAALEASQRRNETYFFAAYLPLLGRPPEPSE